MTGRRNRSLLAAVLVTAGLGAGALADGTGPMPPQWRAEVLAAYPHDPRAFTQGLFLNEGALYESTGNYGASSMRIVDLATGVPVVKVDLPSQHFGEGATLAPQGVVQLTWKEGIAHIWDPASLERRGQFRYRGEGWGLTSDGERFYMTDGSEVLQVRNLKTFDLESTVTITVRGQPLKRVNELEFVDGRIWANVWHEDEIVRFDPETGVVDAFVSLRGLLPPAQRQRENVLNGIAYDPAQDIFYITGKNWPRLFAVRLRPPTP